MRIGGDTVLGGHELHVVIGFLQIFFGEISELDCVEEAEDDEDDDVADIADHQEIYFVR